MRLCELRFTGMIDTLRWYRIQSKSFISLVFWVNYIDSIITQVGTEFFLLVSVYFSRKVNILVKGNLIQSCDTCAHQ